MSDGPSVLRVAGSALVLAAWLGAALLLAASVAPAAFATLPSRTLAGLVIGRVLPVVFITGILAALVAIVLELSGPAHPFRTGRLTAYAATALSCAIAQFVVGPRIHRLREAIGPSLDALAGDDPRRLAFGRLHGVSVAWMGAGMLAAGVALVLCLLALRPRS